MVDTNPAFLGQPRLLSTAAGGTALTTTRGHIAVPPGIRHVILSTRNYATAVVAKVQFNPYLRILVTMDAMATDPTDASENAQDGVAATVVTLSSLPTLANGGAVYIGAADMFSGIQVDVNAADGGADTMAVTYWDGDSWANITPTDNTSNWGSDGSVTWTVPTDWAKTTLREALALGFPRKGTGGEQLYWTRFVTSAALDASTTLSSIYSLNRYGDSGAMELASGQVFQTKIERKFNGGNISALTDAGTANLIVNGYYS